MVAHGRAAVVELSEAAKLLPSHLQPVVRRRVVRWRHRGLRPTDVLLVSYPKSGSTWLRFLLAHALTAEGADFDSVRDTVPRVGRHRRARSLLPDGGRILRTHEPVEPFLARPGQRIVYLARDGRDVALSYLAHQRRYGTFEGGTSEFVRRFLEGGVDNYGPWHDHVLAAVALQRSERADVLHVRYEDLRRDTVAELHRVLAFCGAADRGPGRPSLEEVVAANTKDGMRAKEAHSAFLASKSTDGTPFVRPDTELEWADLVEPDIRDRFDQVCRPALRAAGYEVDGQTANPESGP